MIRYIGVTGHSSRVRPDALDDYPYDCALITLNAAREVMDDPEDLDRFFRLAQEKEVGVIGMNVDLGDAWRCPHTCLTRQFVLCQRFVRGQGRFPS